MKGPAGQEKPLIITTIKPLAIIAKSAVGEHARVETLQSQGQSVMMSPYGIFSKEGEQWHLLSGWAVVSRGAWVDPWNCSHGKSSFFLGNGFLPARNTEDSGHHHHDHHAEMDLAFDPHIWLNPANANIVANSIQQRLAAPSPSNQPKVAGKTKGRSGAL